MVYKEVLRKLCNFTDKLQDEESKRLFDARFMYFLNRNKEEFYEKLDRVLFSKSREYRSTLLEKYYVQNPQNKEKEIVVFGGGENGKTTVRSLQFLGKRINCICDNNKELHGTEYRGIPIHGFSYIEEECKDCVIIVAASQKYQSDIWNQLMDGGFLESNILMNHRGEIYCDIPGQYFDLPQLFEVKKEEYFVDAGCFNGGTSMQCASVLGNDLKKIYAFEPNEDNCITCDKQLASIGCAYELYQAATWSAKAVLNFRANELAADASKVVMGGEITVLGESIDSKLSGRIATYIKLDVEGSELETLKGAVNTIKQYRPRLAISIYHKPEDIVLIPIFLEELGMDYKYYLRHYQTRMQESVLYAI